MRLSWKMPMMVATGPSLERQYSGTYMAVAEHGVDTFGCIGAYRFENEHGSHLYCAAHHTHGLRGATSTVEWILAPKCALIGDDFDLSLAAAKVRSDLLLGTALWDDCTDQRLVPSSVFAQGGSHEITFTLARYVDTMPSLPGFLC